MPFIVTLARWLSPDFFGAADRSGQPVLVTIPYSHFVEFARWSTQLGGIAFTEVGYAPLQHVLPVLAIRLGGERKHIADTSSVAKIPKAGHAAAAGTSDGDPLVKHPGKKRGGATNVPVMVLPGGSVLADSWSIAAASGLTPMPDEESKRIYDEELAPLTRQWAYYYLLKPAHRSIFASLCTRGRHWLWRLAFTVVGGRVNAALVNIFACDDRQAFLACRAKLKEVVAHIEATRLKGRKGPYLGGEAPGVEDVALASLFACVVLPQAYCEGRFEEELTAIEAADAEMREELIYWRETAVGKFTLDMYEKHRRV